MIYVVVIIVLFSRSYRQVLIKYRSCNHKVELDSDGVEDWGKGAGRWLGGEGGSGQH